MSNFPQNCSIKAYQLHYIYIQEYEANKEVGSGTFMTTIFAAIISKQRNVGK
jgi:hypothetical protein